MDKSILNRIKALEEKKPSELIIFAITDSGETVTRRTKDIITEEGTLKEGYSGVGVMDKGIVKSGDNLKELDRVLSYFQREAEKSTETHSEKT